MECPDCGESYVSREVGPRWPPSTQFGDAIVDLEDGESAVLHRQCWTCGWSEDRHLTVTEIETEHGDPEAITHQQQLTQLVNELEQIDDTEVVKEILRDVRNRRSADIEPTGSEDGE
ncbi:hypothetical protein MBEHAL_2482 [Halarchaeum acidiphilum MH1-52-1]|uniref:Small CPxCG-related zinc finger protein n=1 Tax=Halarchaeum acidiphilum MH1-52-1 TaxID=1261545 RepID=U2YY42_9EURY|nr:hypothetical protein [Halarchaeum acidiphilum]GAD53722.1 hypothetical protein MBEHAL_2482 [Halarchaeum acidiphilum MH1-52-1]